MNITAPRRAQRPATKREVDEQLVALAADGRITPVIERVLPWDAAVSGLERLESGRTVGKVVVLGRE